MDAGAGKKAGLSVQRQTVDLPLEDVGVVRHGRQVDTGRVLAPRRVHRLIELPLLILAERHPSDQKAPPKYHQRFSQCDGGVHYVTPKLTLPEFNH